MILVIDNYDSFVYNLYQLIGKYRQDMKVIRNNELTVKEIEDLNPEAIIISPGPGNPKNAGIIEEVVQYFYDKKPILGICLGHQAIVEALGGEIGYAKQLMHGKSSLIEIDNNEPIFNGLDKEVKVARYHSLAAVKLPDTLKCIGKSKDDEIMAIKHVDYPVYGFQFHPESILTDEGDIMIKNFLGGYNND